MQPLPTLRRANEHRCEDQNYCYPKMPSASNEFRLQVSVLQEGFLDDKLKSEDQPSSHHHGVSTPADGRPEDSGLEEWW